MGKNAYPSSVYREWWHHSSPAILVKSFKNQPKTPQTSLNGTKLVGFLPRILPRIFYLIFCIFFPFAINYLKLSPALLKLHLRPFFQVTGK
jgi:hypothetical protein